MSLGKKIAFIYASFFTDFVGSLHYLLQNGIYLKTMANLNVTV